MKNYKGIFAKLIDDMTPEEIKQLLERGYELKAHQEEREAPGAAEPGAKQGCLQ